MKDGFFTITKIMEHQMAKRQYIMKQDLKFTNSFIAFKLKFVFFVAIFSLCIANVALLFDNQFD